jgi:hypothetical protein
MAQPFGDEHNSAVSFTLQAHARAAVLVDELKSVLNLR